MYMYMYMYAMTLKHSNKTRNEFLRKCEIEIKTVSAESTELSQKQQKETFMCM